MTDHTEQQRCPVCKCVTDQPFVAAVWHFRPFEWHGWGYVFGNVRMFGFWDGMRANLTLYFPFANTLINWKHRKAHLEIGD